MVGVRMPVREASDSGGGMADKRAPIKRGGVKHHEQNDP